jgi:endonuclease/exonuclease/phosphatase (EEP) superfamily protein YafD
MSMILYVFSILVVSCALIPLLNWGHWAIRVLDFPRAQLLVINILLFLVLIFLFFSSQSLTSLILIILLIASASIDIYRVYPYTRLAQFDVPNSKTSSAEKLKFLSSNIFQDNKHYDKLLELVKEQDPDILLLLETDKTWLHHVEELKNSFPHHILLPQDNTYGMLLLSKLKIKSHEVHFLNDNGVPSIFAKLDWPNKGEFQLIAIHPRPPRPQEGSSHQRDGELMQVANYIREHKKESFVVFGDLNDVAWSHTTRLFLRVSGLLDPRIGRGFFSTFHAKYPILRFPLDHIFVSPSFKLVELERMHKIGSDHFPIMASFTYDYKIANQPVADPEEVEESKELIQRENK